MPLNSKLYPEIQPFNTGRLKVGQGHSIYFEQYGNPKKPAVLILHGGPGGSISEKYGRLANPKTTHIIAFDQRGCGKSTPKGSLKDNTTTHQLADIEKLREHLNIASWIVVGGSWGSTLALAYAEAHPQSVLGLVIGGIFTNTQAEHDWITSPGGLPSFHPLEYQMLSDLIGNPPARQFDKAALKALTGRNQTHALEVARAFAKYEFGACVREPDRAKIAQEVESIPDLLDSTRIELHYLANHCFLKPNQLLDNLHRIAHIPTYIYQGAYDMVCPPAAAIRLHAQHPNSTLNLLPQAPHYGDPALDNARVTGIKALLKQLG